MNMITGIIRRVVYFGHRYRCPFCNARLRALQPFGFTFPVIQEKKVIAAGRRLALCPVCGSLDRERLLYLYLRHRTHLFQRPMKVLHVAPELRLAAILRSLPNLDYLTADISGRNVMVPLDVTDIPFPDASFDAIICNHVLEHVPDDRKAMSRLYRVLKPGGWAILQVPLSPVLKATYEDFSIVTAAGREAAFGQDDHVRIYAADYRDRLVQAGFAVDVFQWATEPGEFGGPQNTFGLIPDEPVFVARRPQ